VRSSFITNILRLTSLVLVGLSFVVTDYPGVREIGQSMQWTNGKADISAGSNPNALLWAAAAIALFILLMVRKPSPITEGVPGRIRRILSFLIDFVFSLSTTSSVVALIPLWLEAQRTGHFAWYFHRNYSVNTDSLSAISSLLSMALMVLYFAFPLTRGRQTVGCFIMRTRVTPPFGNEGRFTVRAALMRVFYAFGGLCRLWRNRDRDEQGRTWYDRKTACTVVLVSDE
jgi:hypothetical protein